MHSLKSYIKVRWGSILNTFNSVLHNKSELMRLNKKKTKDPTKLQINDSIYKILLHDSSFLDELSHFFHFLNPIKIAIRICESRTVYVADTMFIFAVLGTHLIQEYQSRSKIIRDNFKFYALFRFLHRWGELLEIESGFAILCYILHHLAYRTKGINSKCLEESLNHSEG